MSVGCVDVVWGEVFVWRGGVWEGVYGESKGVVEVGGSAGEERVTVLYSLKANTFLTFIYTLVIFFYRDSW